MAANGDNGCWTPDGFNVRQAHAALSAAEQELARAVVLLLLSSARAGSCSDHTLLSCSPLYI